MLYSFSAEVLVTPGYRSAGKGAPRQTVYNQTVSVVLNPNENVIDLSINSAGANGENSQGVYMSMEEATKLYILLKGVIGINNLEK